MSIYWSPTGYADCVDRRGSSGAALSEDGDTKKPGEDARAPGEERKIGREEQAKLLGARISCAVGLLRGVGGFVAALLGGGANISAGALGAALGIAGYFLGARGLATATVFLCVAAIFFGLAASQGMIPGIEASDHAYPGVEN